jgi:hypothetical protein
MKKVLQMDYNKISINFDDIHNVNVDYDNPFIMEVTYDGVKFEYLINLSPNTDKIIVLSSGAYDSNKFNPPVFQRHAWMNELGYSAIYCNDPTLYLGKMNLGWGYGEKDRHYLADSSKILSSIFKKLNVSNENVLFYGSSGGGFMSMILAAMHKSVALVNNPQTIFTNFFASQVNILKNAVIPGEEFDVKRVDVVAFFNEIKYIPRIHYLLNMASEHDIEKHFKPFIEGLREINESLFKNNVNIEFYMNKDQGHNPLDKEETIKIIKEAMEKL